MRLIALMSLVFLSACGVSDVATTAVTGAKIKAEQARQGKETIDKVRADLDVAATSGQARTAAAESEK